MNSFFDHYELHRSIDNVSEKFIKSPENKICRFCNKGYPQVSFNTIPHIIPELFGRNRWTSNFECDECNKQFQKMETDTSTMVQHYLSILQIKTKKGVPTFQSSKKPFGNSTTIKSVGNSLKLNFGANLDDFKYDEENISVSLFLRTKKFRPFSVYKTFLKLGLSLLSSKELASNDHYLHFLNSNEPINNGIQFWRSFRYVLKTKYHTIPKASLYKAKTTIDGKTVYPEYTLVLYFSNVVFQFFLPISKKNILEHRSDNNLVIDVYPSFMLERLESLKSIEVHNLDLDEENPVSIIDTITLYYDRIDKDINNQNRDL